MQVYVSYGPKTSSALLLSYGFLPASNAHDGVVLRFGLRREDPQYASKLACLEMHGRQEAMDFPVRLDGIPHSLLPYVAFITAPLRDADVEPVGHQLLVKARPQCCMFRTSHFRHHKYTVRLL